MWFSLPRETEESVPTGPSPAEDWRKSCFLTGKAGLCNPEKHHLKRWTGKHFHQVACTDGGAACGSPQVRCAEKVVLVQNGSFLGSCSHHGAGFCRW